MNLPAAIAISSCALGVGGVATYLALAPTSVEGATTPTTSVDRQAGTGAEGELTALREAISDMQRQLDVVASGSRAAAGVDQADIAAAVAAYLSENPDLVAEAAAATGAAKVEEPKTAADFMGLLAEAGELESTQLWGQIVAAGLDGEILALFKAAADAAPGDPDVQLALGNAYLGRTQEAGSSPLAGKYATLADQALDAALEADPEHWEARFTKAAALSFWPPVFGKQPEAIRNFEILVGQQAGLAPSEEHASTHLLLGNMYQQSGMQDKALAAWRAGLSIFPDNADLQSQIALLEGR